jgi:arylsulfatase A-like enzyme
MKLKLKNNYTFKVITKRYKLKHRMIIRYLITIAGILLMPLIIFAQQTKPNIVWITIEDTSPDFIGCYGNTEVKTPNIDALAAEGIRFTNAHSTNTVCSPSRAMIITGVRTAESGCGNHRSALKIPSYVKGFASYVKDAGYFTSNNSKTDYNISNEKLFIQQNWTMQGNKADFTKRENKTQPFFSVFNIDESHQSRTMSNSKEWYEKNVLSQLRPEEIIQPDNLTVPPFYKTNDNNRRNMARLYNSLQAMDKKVGQLIQKIKDEGEWDNTIVFFFGDHGQGMPRFKTNASRLGTQVPFVIRFPEKYKQLIKTSVNNTFSELVTFEDLAPTIISLACNNIPPSYMKGRIFLGDKKQPTDNVFWGCRDNADEVIDMGRTIIKGDYAYARIYYPHLPVLQREVYFDKSDMVKQMRNDYASGNLDSLQASIFKPRSAEYLFNIKTDKWETVNLALDKKYAALLIEMRKLNQQKIKAYNDIGFVHQTVLAQIDKSDTLLVWKKKNYNVAKYLPVAEMIGMGKKYLAKQVSLLSDKDSIKRYWAVVGLRNQEAVDLNNTLIMKAFENEKSDFVKVELADVLASKFNNVDMLNWLADMIINSSNSYIVRQAAMKLANNENLPAAIIEKLKVNVKVILEKNKGEMNYAIQSAISSAIGVNMEED